jgi:hypothetical protein
MTQPEEDGSKQATFSVDMEKELFEIYDEWLVANRAAFDELTEPRKIFVAAWEVWANALWDGFLVSFGNTKESLKFAESALAAIGATTSLKLFKEALSVTYPSGLPLNLEEASTRAWIVYQGGVIEYEKISDRCHDLDQEFYQYEDDLPETSRRVRQSSRAKSQTRELVFASCRS